MPLDDRLSQAAESGAIDTVIGLIDEIRSYAPDTVQDSLQLALLWAAIGGQEATIERLVSEGADINAPEPTRGNIPIVEAAIKGRTNSIMKIIDLGGRVDVTDRWGRNPLEMARIHGHTNVVTAIRHKTKGEQGGGGQPAICHE